MILGEVLGDAARSAPPVDVVDLAYDARVVRPGTLFFCVPGFTRDGHDYAPEAIARGAVALVVQRPLGLGVPEVLVPDVRAAMAPAAARLYGDPTAALRAVGITGTNGKTTSAFLVRSLLEAAGRRTGLLGTVTAVIGGGERPVGRTTPEAIDLQRTFREMADRGDEAVGMEVSSHALALRRADAIHWAVAIFTNLTQDHLDFHPTMEDYFLAKRRLFMGEPRPEVAIVNVDDAYGARLAAELPDAVRIGIDSPDAQLRATDIACDATGSTFTLDGLELRAPLPGRFNVLNVLGALASAWRRALGCQVIGVTGSTGKTSTKDVLAGMLAPQRRVVATAQNLNTEIGLPLTVLGAPAGTEVLVLEMAIRGAGQIAELAAIAEPDVGVVVNVGPVHLELLGSIEAIAAAKAELIAGLRAGGTAVVPAGEALLEAHLRADVTTVTFGPGGDVAELPAGLTPPFTSAHMRRNAPAALAAARAVGVGPAGGNTGALSDLRGQRIELPGGIVVVNDCYNANPMSMRAALDDLAASAAGRRVAVLGDMLELGPGEREFHAQAGADARRAGVDVLVTVGERAREMAAGYDGRGAVHAVPDAGAAAALVPALLRPGDVVLVKGSRGVGLEVVARALEAA